MYGAPLAERRPVLDVTRPQAFFARLGQSPMIGIGESYMAREWSVGEGTDLADALAPFAERLTDLIKPMFYNLRHTVLPRGLNPANTKEGAKKNIEAHYDLSNEMFQQFLDPSLSYSSALFDTLDTRAHAGRPRGAPSCTRSTRSSTPPASRAAPVCWRSAPAGARSPSGPPSAARP